MRLVSRIWQTFLIRRQQIFCLISPGDIVAVQVKATVSITEVSPKNVERVTDFKSEILATTFRGFLEEGQYGVYAWLESKVVGHAWAKVCRQSHCRVNGYMDIYQGDALIHYCNVSKAQRGQNIYPLMLVALCRCLFSQARVSRILIDTEVSNSASLRGITKVGFEPLGTGTYVQLGGHLLFKHFTSLSNRPAAETRKVK